MAKKKGDFDKAKLRVGKAKPKQANQTATGFSSKAIVVPTQLKGPSLDAYLALTKHHQAPQRRQAVANIAAHWHHYPKQLGRILASVAPMIVDEDRLVRQAVLSALADIDDAVLKANVTLVLLYVHAAMTHISTQIRADSTKSLDLVVRRCPNEVARLGFARSLDLFFPLLGWSTDGADRARQSETALNLGKTATKTRGAHLQSLLGLLELGVAPDPPAGDVLYHPDSRQFLIPTVESPFAAGFTEDAEERREVIDSLRVPLLSGLDAASKEGGESGRLASKIASLVAR